MSKYRFKTEQEFKDDYQWDYDLKRDVPISWVGKMIEQLGKPLDDSYNKKIESSKWFTHKGDGFIYSSNDVKLMENKEELLPIGTKVYIRDDSEHFKQGVKDGEKLIGVIMGHMSVEYAHREYIYEIE